jgi:hypothetical protein
VKDQIQRLDSGPLVGSGFKSDRLTGVVQKTVVRDLHAGVPPSGLMNKRVSFPPRIAGDVQPLKFHVRHDDLDQKKISNDGEIKIDKIINDVK